MKDIEMDVIHKQLALDELPNNLKFQFMDYVTHVTEHKKRKNV